jgi:hypothetical protein
MLWGPLYAKGVRIFAPLPYGDTFRMFVRKVSLVRRMEYHGCKEAAKGQTWPHLLGSLALDKRNLP